MLHILFICTGNTCRSPMAEALLRNKIVTNHLETQVAVSSAGIAAFGETEASVEAQSVMQSKGLNLTKHRSCQLAAQHLKAADIILTMTESHKRAVLSMTPQQQSNIYTLAEFAGGSGDISDPFGGDVIIYEDCAQQIGKKIDGCWVKILALAGKKN